MVRDTTPREARNNIGRDDEGGSGFFGIADDLAMMLRDELADTIFATDRALGALVVKDVVAVLAK